MAAVTLIFHATFRLSGVVNVALVLLTRPNVLLFGARNRDDGEDNKNGRVVEPDRARQNNGEYPLRQRNGMGQEMGPQMGGT